LSVGANIFHKLQRIGGFHELLTLAPDSGAALFTSVVGQVVTSSGAPAAGATVKVSRSGLDVATGTTGADGSFIVCAVRQWVFALLGLRR
jgi:hypothetical protein